jgi:hypothetical protein
MKHLLKKISMMGGGGKKPKTKPATLTPPQIGTSSMSASYSYAEMLDLVSDGPIEGLVNQNGLILSGKDILQGIYLNDTAVAVSDDALVESKSPAGFTSATNTSAVAVFNRFFTNLQGFSMEDRGSAPVGYKPINQTSYFQILTSKGYQNYNLSIADFSHYVQRYKNGTNLQQNGPTLANDAQDFVNFFDMSLNTKVNIYNQIGQNFVNFDGYITELLKVLTTNLINHHDNTSNAHEKEYINKNFSKNFGTDWKNKRTTMVESLANEKLRSRDIIYILRPQSADKIAANVSLLNSDNTMGNFKFTLEQGSSGIGLEEDPFATVYDFTFPYINTNGTTTGSLGGFLIVKIAATIKNILAPGSQTSLIYYASISAIGSAARSNTLTLKKETTISATIDNSKFNYTNILAEYRAGEEYQNPFQHFKNILIDKNYGSDLLGPFIRGAEVQRILENKDMIIKDFATFNLLPISAGGLVLEGSVDSSRTTQGNFSDWNKNQSIYNEVAIPIKHVVHNPNVRSVFVTIQINSLSDTLSKTRTDVEGASKKTLDAGSKFPSVVNIEIETGVINDKGVETNAVSRKFRIVALIESPTLIDIGSPDLTSFRPDNYSFIRGLSGENPFTPFLLSNVESDTGSALDVPSKRYVKITKLSTETNSVLINKDISLVKVTEIIPLNFSYPYSSIVATKIDSRSFGSIPTRTFDCKLKKVKVPSNYFPSFKNGRDKRYYSTVANFNNASLYDKRVYDGDWDGTLSDELQWTDNPAWILYDLLTSHRYGLGQYIDADNDIDIFDLYKIGRFCDAVDDEGYFVGVPDNAGGLEPRFSCNIMFNEGIKVFDALNTISALFRGLIYYNNSQINFVDDRPRTPIALFANTNVKDGIFNYTNYRRDEQFNSIEVVYIDRLDNFLTKVEYVEDEDDIRKRGIFKKTINANGVTSRAMARRLGQHLIFQTIKENQSISFTAGLESLLCKPGDLIIIEDELKSLKSNFGKVLSVNPVAGSIRLNEQFADGQFNNILTVYAPTGYSTNSEIQELGQSDRTRLSLGQFTLTRGDAGTRYDAHTGAYRFSGYTSGFSSDKVEINETLRSQYALYTGVNNRLCYYSTPFTGWVLATGVPFTNQNLYNKFIFHPDNHDFTEVNRGSGYVYSSSNASGRGTMFVASTAPDGPNSLFKDISGLELAMTRGLLDSDISLTSSPQITSFTITGITNYEYGCEAFVRKTDINYSLIPFVAEGSLYRFQRKLADDEVYKVVSIKEEAPNEYSLIGTKFNRSKYELIENDKSIVTASATVSYTLNQKIGDRTYRQLRSPVIADLITGEDSLGFYISGRWNSVSNARGYNVKLYQPNGTVQTLNLVGKDSTGEKFNTEGIGNYSYQVSASGNFQSATATSYYDSDYSSSGLFLVYEGDISSVNDRPYLSSVTIL